MYTDPQSITINAVPTSFPRVGSPSPDRKGVFRTSDGDFSFEVSQFQTAGRFRREVRLTQTKVAVDPISAENKEVSASAIIVIDEPKWGFSDTDLGHLSDALTGWFTSGNRDDLLGGEL